MAQRGLNSSEGSPLSFETESKTLLNDHDGLESDNESAWNTKSRTSRHVIPRPSTVRGWIFLAFATAAASLLGVALGLLIKPQCTEQQCIQMTSGYSPALEAVKIIDYQFQGEFGDENVFKGRPRPELDAAWERVSALHEVSMDRRYLPLINKTSHAISYPEEKGGGYMVELEVFHQLHCLNLLRQRIYLDYYSQPEFKPIMFNQSPKKLYNHIDHCVDTLRQLIMCSGDVSPVTANWVITHRNPHPDFNTLHKCRDFDALLEWAEKKDIGGVPREFPDDTWWPEPKLAETYLDYIEA